MTPLTLVVSISPILPVSKESKPTVTTLFHPLPTSYTNLTELSDLHFQSICVCPVLSTPDTGALLFDALIDNFCLRKINLRGNTFDDDVAESLGDLLHANNILEDLDLGDNQMGHLCCRSLALGTALLTPILYLSHISSSVLYTVYFK